MRRRGVFRAATAMAVAAMAGPSRGQSGGKDWAQSLFSEGGINFGPVPRALLIARAERVLVSADITGHWQLRFSRWLAPLL